MKIINRVTLSNGVHTQILCDFDDGSRWTYSKGAEVEWTKREPTDTELEESLKMFLHEH
jgi:hypothetical protein